MDMFWDVTAAPSTPRRVQPSHFDTHLVPERRTENSVRELEGRIDRLTMICCAMWTIIQAHTDATDADLERMVRELDLSDGSEDGKARIPQVRDCHACHRPVATRHLRCLYCGAHRETAHPFDAVL